MIHGAKFRIIILAVIGGLSVLVFPECGALAGNEAHPDRSHVVEAERYELKNALLTRVAENTITVDKKDFIFNDHTEFFKQDASGLKKITPDTIIPPCLVDIAFKTYTHYTEGRPFQRGDKVLMKVLIKGKPGAPKRK